MFLFKRKEEPAIDVIDSSDDTIKLETADGRTIYAKKVLSVNGKHVVYVDQYGKVREAFLK